MFKTYRFIPCVFILFLFGLTLITVSPVFAEESPEFIACQQIKPQGDFQLMKQKKNCFRDLARTLNAHILDMTACMLRGDMACMAEKLIQISHNEELINIRNERPQLTPEERAEREDQRLFQFCLKHNFEYGKGIDENNWKQYIEAHPGSSEGKDFIACMEDAGLSLDGTNP